MSRQTSIGNKERTSGILWTIGPGVVPPKRFANIGSIAVGISLKDFASFLAGGGVQFRVLPRGIFSISDRLFFHLFWRGKYTVLDHLFQGLAS